MSRKIISQSWSAIASGLPSFDGTSQWSVPQVYIAGLRHSDHITLWHTRQFPWVESPGECSLQAGDSRVSFTERHGTILSGCRPPTFVWHAIPTTSDAVVTDPSAGCHVRQSQCATVGDRPFAIADARLSNNLPLDIVACDTLWWFRRKLKIYRFRQSYTRLLSFLLFLLSLRFLLSPH